MDPICNKAKKIAVIAFTVLMCNSSPIVSAQTSRGSVKANKGYFISIDGLQSPLLESYVRTDDASPSGFAQFWKKGAVFPKTAAHLISITAASHASTSTCVSPAKHGVVGNHYLENHRRVNGFQIPYRTKTMWEVARAQNKKVVSFAYAGVDGSTPARTVDAGMTYPDDFKIGSPQVVELLDQSILPVIVEVPLLSGTKRELNLQIHGAGESRGKPSIVWKDFNNASHKTAFAKNRAGMNFANLIFNDSERMRRIMVYEIDAKKGKFLISRASYNAAFPEGFRKSLDDASMIWPDVNIKKMNLAMTPSETVEMLATLDDFIAEAAFKFLPNLNADIVLMYQPLIDSTGHALQNALPDASSLARRDPVTRAYRSAYAHVDKNLSMVLSQATPEDVVAVMGDHGMTPTLTNVNIASLITKDVDDYFDVYASDAMLFLYPKPDSTDATTIKNLGHKVKRSLRNLKWHGKLVFESSKEKAATKDNSWPYGDAAWAYRTHPGFWLGNNSLEPKLFVPARVPGMHGHNPNSRVMLTSLLIRGAGVKRGIYRTGSTSLAQAVPTFARLLKIEPPSNCDGAPLF